MQPLEKYVTGTGQKLKVHAQNEDCLKFGCVIHKPTEHGMLTFPTHWREDRGLMERICPCGIGHPDPDDLAFKGRRINIEYAKSEAVHGCCGIHCR